MNKHQINLIAFTCVLLTVCSVFLPFPCNGASKNTQSKTIEKKKAKVAYLKQDEDKIIISKNLNAFEGYDLLKEHLGVTAMEKHNRDKNAIQKWAKNKAALKNAKFKARNKCKLLKNQIKHLNANNKQTSVNIKKEHMKSKLNNERRNLKNISTQSRNEDTRLTKSLEPDKHEQLNKHISNVGQTLSIIDAAKGAYYKDKDGKIHFSTSKYLSNVGMNLSGLGALKGTIDAGVLAKRKEFKKIINEYKRKHGDEKIPPKIIEEAHWRAFKKGMYVGTYNGAKCVPVLGDVIATGELVEASYGLYKDTAQSNRIQAENKVAQKEQGRDAVAALNAKYAELKDCRKEFDKLQGRSAELSKNFMSFKSQYIEVFSRSVNREKSFADGDALAKAAELAKPYMDPNRVDELRNDSQKISQAVKTTIKLAETTLENQETNGGDPAILKKTYAELAKLVGALEECAQECATTTKMLNPLLGGGATLRETEELSNEAVTDATISGSLYASAGDTVNAHRDLLKRSEALRQAQSRILQETKKLRFHFFRTGDASTKTDVEIGYRNAIQYKIDDYSINKLKEKQKTLRFEFNRLRGATQISEGLPPELADEIRKAAELAPEITKINDGIASTIMRAKEISTRLNQLMKNSPLPETTTNDVVRDSPTPSSASFADMSMNDVAALVSFAPKKGKPVDGRLKVGFIYHANSDHFSTKWDNPAATPIYYGTYRKLLKKGSMTIWADLNSNNKKDAGEKKTLPYWIWYDIGASGVSCGPNNPFDDLPQSKKRTCEAEWLTSVSFFSDTNVTYGITGQTKRGITASEITLDGRATYPPFTTRVRIRTVMQIGGMIMDSSEMRKNKLWIFQKSKERILSMMAFWETGMEKTARDLLNSTLEIPKKYTIYLRQHFFLNAHVADGVILRGFEIKRRSKKSGNYWKRSMWLEMESKNETVIKTSEKARTRVRTTKSYRISARIRFPETKETIREFFKRVREKAVKSFKNRYKRYGIRKINVSNSDLSLITTTRKTHNITNGYGVVLKKKVDIAEHILMVRNNAVVEIYGNGRGMLDANPKIQTMNLARRIIAKFKKHTLK